MCCASQSAQGFDSPQEKVGSVYTKAEIVGSSGARSRFENLAQKDSEDTRKRAEEAATARRRAGLSLSWTVWFACRTLQCMVRCCRSDHYRSR